VGDVAIALRGITFTYAAASQPCLREIDLTVRQGELITLMGATGAGKSTLAKCLNRTIPAFHGGRLEGEIEILGRTLHSEGVAELAGLVGLLSQDFEAQLFATNVLQEIAFAMEQLGVPASTMHGRAREALAVVGLSGFEHRDPATLSGGEKQRLAIAAILALRPPVLIFDEPTTDLDPIGKEEIFAVLDRLRGEGSTLILIEHEIAAAERADRVVVMEAGRIVADSPPQRLLPQVKLLENYSIRPADIDRLTASLALSPTARHLDALAASLQGRIATTAPAPASGSPPESPAVLVTEQASYLYDDNHVAVDGVDLTIRAGDSLALIGQNGSGKTTLAKLLNGLLRPSSGNVLLNGRSITDLPLNRVAGEVGYVFQNPDHQIFASTVYDEVAFGPRNLGLSRTAVDERVGEALDAVRLRGFEQDDPFLFAKGQRQRLAVASLLALRPRVLILDEPTTGLDYPEQRQMMDLVARLQAQGMTLVMITHSPWVVAEYARRAVLLTSGRVLFDGPLRALFAQEELLERCHFRLPDVTRLGRRFGITPLSVEELAACATSASTT
jgi:cobalt transport protein ATP-binding subunit